MKEEYTEQIGTPTMALLPARNYRFRAHNQEHRIEIPRRGKYADLAPEIFGEEEGDFMIYDEESKIMYLPAISKVLFASGKYPDLGPAHMFAPIAFMFEEDKVVIIGQVVEMLPPKK